MKKQSHVRALGNTDGNLTSDGHWTYTWDAENRLIAMEEKTSTRQPPRLMVRQRLEFRYDAGGRRIAKKVLHAEGNGTFVLKSSQVFLYDGWNMIGEFSLQNSAFILQRSYEWGPDVSGSFTGAGGVGGLILIKQPSTTVNNSQPSSTVYAPLYDGNGNMTELCALSTSTVAARYEYSAFGETITTDGSAIADSNPFRFSTKYEDRETGLYYYGYRYYAPETGRWLNRDPIGEEGGLNLYGMVGNDAVNHLDNLGLAAENPLSYYLPYLYPGVFDPPSGYPNAVWNAVLLSAPVKAYKEKIFNMSKHIGRGCDVTEFEAEGLDDHVWLASSEGLPMKQKIKAGLIAGGIDINIPPGKITVNCREGNSCIATGEVIINIKDTYGFGPWSGDAHTYGANTAIKYLSCIWGGIPKDYKNSDSKTFPVNYKFTLNQ